MSPTWDILVVTLASREAFLQRLVSRLRPQLRQGVAIVTFADDGERPIGAKRQSLLEQSTADYVCFVDDDDLVSDDYIDRLYGAICQRPDVVGFRLRYFEDGHESGEAVHSYRAASITIPTRPGIRRYDRLPNHLNPVRRELALQAGFPPTNFGEDSDYAKRLRDLGPHREQFVDAPVYDYLYRYARPGERTNASDRRAR